MWEEVLGYAWDRELEGMGGACARKLWEGFWVQEGALGWDRVRCTRGCGLWEGVRVGAGGWGAVEGVGLWLWEGALTLGGSQLVAQWGLAPLKHISTSSLS